MNFILSQIDRSYLAHIQAYNQLLLQRNRLLKDDRPSDLLLETFSERMEPHAAYVHQARRNLCEQLRPLIREFYATLSRGKEEVDLAYRSDLDEAPLGELFAREAERFREKYSLAEKVPAAELPAAVAAKVAELRAGVDAAPAR